MNFIFFVLTLFGISSTGYAELKIAGSGQASAIIIRRNDADQQEIKATEELAHFLEQVTDAKFSIQNSAGSTSLAQILVGESVEAKRSFPDIPFDKLKPEQIIIQTKGNKLLLAGGSPAATLDAVYKFLQDHVGCRWWAPWAVDIPHKTELILPEINVSESPVFEMRFVGWFHAFPNIEGSQKVSDLEWQSRNLLTGCNCESMAHTFYNLAPPDKYFDEHPEWYGMIKGERSRTAQFCLSNKELRNFVAGQIIKKIENNPALRFVSVSQMDWDRACECDNCQLLNAKTGGQSGAMIDFVNDVARQVNAKYPKVKIQTLAYNYTEIPPSPAANIKADPNVIVEFCPISLNHSVGLDAPENQFFYQGLKDWSKITNTIYVWDYPANLNYYGLPYPNWFLIGHNLRTYRENGVKGMFVEGAFNSNGGEMAELRSWLYSRLFWNPDQDDSALINEFLNGYYGSEAAPLIRKYMELLAQNNRDFILNPWPDLEKAPFLKYEVLRQAEDLFRQAENAVQNDKDKLWRVKRAHLSLQQVFVLRWDELQAEAQAANLPWISDLSREEYSYLWFNDLNADDGPPGWTKPTHLGEGNRLDPNWMERFLHPPIPAPEDVDTGYWLHGWTEMPMCFMWIALASLLLSAIYKAFSGSAAKAAFRNLNSLALLSFIIMIGIYSFWEPYWTGKRLLYLFVAAILSILFSLSAFFLLEYARGFRKMILLQILVLMILAAGIWLQSKPYFEARYHGRNASLPAANLSRSNFYSTNLEGANFERAELKQSYFRDAWLSYVNLRFADLRGADFRYSTLNGTLFDGADLRGADFSKSYIAGASLKGAKYNEQTKFPLKFNPADYSAVFEK